MDTIEYKAIKLIGLALPYTTTNKNGRSAIDCGTLWQRFEKEQFSDRIPGKIKDSIVAVYHHYEGDHTQPYHYFIGCPVDELATVPEGMESLLIPKDVYHQLTAKGTMPDCVADAWRKIWATELPRAYHFDFEVYDARSKDWSNAEVDIFISVRV